MPRASLAPCLLVVLCGALGAGPAGAQDDLLLLPPEDEALDPVTALAGLKPDTAVVYTGEELYRRGYRTLGEALRDTVGIFQRQTPAGPRYSARGIKDGLALIIDGIPHIIDGERDLLDVDRTLDLRDLEQIEIVRGPSSAIWGVTALAGVVRVTTRRPLRTGATVGLRTGLIDPLALGAETEAFGDVSLRRGDVGLFAIGRARIGPRQRFRYDNAPTQYFPIGGVFVPGALTDHDVLAPNDSAYAVRAGAEVFDLRADVSHQSNTEHTPLSTFSHAVLADRPEQSVRHRTRGRILLNTSFWRFSVQGAAFLAQHLREDTFRLYPTGDVLPFGGDIITRGRTLRGGFRLRTDFALTDDHRFIGAAFGELGQNTAAADATDAQTGERVRDLVQISDLDASGTLAGEYQGDLPWGLFVTAGAALRYRTGFPLSFAPRASLAYVPVPMVSFRVSYAEGTREPDKFDLGALSRSLVAGTVAGVRENPQLQPEHVRNVEAGVSLRPTATTRMSLEAFGVSHAGAVVQVVRNGAVQPVNLGPRYIVGLESDAHLEPVTDSLFFDANVTYAQTLYGPTLNEDLLKAVVQVRARWWQHLEMGLRARSRVDFSVGGLGHTLAVDAFGSYQPAGGPFTLSVAGQNLNDANESTPATPGLAGAVPVDTPGPGRMILFTLTGTL